MKKYILRKILFVLIMLIPTLACADDPAEDKLIVKVRIKSNLKLDAQARKEIASAVAKIMKGKAGTVKLRGSYSSAATADEYLSKSVFMAREVEQYMKTLLPAKQRVYTMFSPFSEEKKNGENMVEIFLYPHELKVADFEGFRVNTVEGKTVVQQLSGTQVEPQSPVEQVPGKPVDAGKGVSHGTVRPEQVPGKPVDAGKGVSHGTVRPEQVPGKPVDAGKSVSYGTVRPEQAPEDAKRAEELVRRVKERAAKRAKRKDDAE